MTSKLHGVCDSKGGRLRLHLREGQCSNFTGADVVRKDLPPVATVMGDQGHDSNKIRKMLLWQGIMPRRCRKKPVHYSKRLDRRRHKIENLFSRQKNWRRLATRYDGCPTSSVLPFSWLPLPSSGDEATPRSLKKKA